MTPNFVDSPLSSLFNYEYIYTYDNTEKIPTVKEGVDSTGITFSYQYLDLNYEEAGWISGCPTDASNYEIIITATGAVEGSCKVKMTINPKKIKTKLIEITYSEASSYNSVDCRYWTKFSDELLNDKIVFTDENGATLPSSLKPNFKINGMTTGDENCEYSTANDIVIGSTYLVNISLVGSSATNFVLYDNETYYSTGKASYGSSGCAVLKYKTVLYNSQYYTIEDVIGKNGDIVIVGDNSKTIFTAFTSFNYYVKFSDSKLTYSLNAGTNLWITYDGSKTLKSNTTGTNIYSCLYIPNNVVLNVDGTINVCGSYKKMTHESYKKGVLFNNGTINLNGKLYSYGYTKGDGIINANSSSKVYDFMRFYNYANSGGITMSLNNAKIFPLSVYSIHNISCDTKFLHDSTYYVTYDVEISSVTIAGDLVIVGDGGLFELSNGYLIKSVEDTTGSFFVDKSVLKTNYNKSNQDVTQRDVLEIYGTFSDNIVEIKESGQGITTGKNYAMPIGFMKIALKDDGKGNVANGTLQANAYKFLPGSVLTIDDGASLTIASGVNVIFYDRTYEQNLTGAHGATVSYYNKHIAWYSQTKFPIDAQLIVNGSLISNGNLGGYIHTESTTGFVQLSSQSAQLKRLTGEDYSSGDKISVGLGGTSATTVTDTIYATGFIDNNDNSTFNSGVYISQYGDHYYWTSATSAEKFIINFYEEDNTLLSSKTVYVLEPTNGQYIYEITGFEFLPSKNYYVFDAWYLSNGTVLSEENNKLIYNVPDTPVTHDPISINLYANWTPIEYSFDFVGIYIDPLTSENVILSEADGFKLKDFINVSFTYNDILNANISIPFTAEYLNCDFNGWYITANAEIILIKNQLSLDDFLKFSTLDLKENIDEKTGSISLLCRFTDYQEYIIQFDDALEEYEDQESLTEVNPYLALELPNINDFNYINEYQTYIMYWSYSPRKADNAVVNSGMTANTILELIDEYNSTASETDKINVVNNTIVLYAITDLKEFTISYYDGSSLKKTHYYNNNYPVTVADGTDSSGNDLTKADENKTTYFVGYIFDGWTLSTNEEDVLSVNDVIWPSGNIILNSHYASREYCTIRFSIASGVTLNVTYFNNGTKIPDSPSSDTVINFDRNTSIIFNFTFAKEAEAYDKPGSWSYTITGSNSNQLANGSGGLSTSVVTKDETLTISENITVTTIYEQGSNCIPSGTLVTLADGSKKKVEDLTLDDMLLVFNHETGMFEAAPIVFIDCDPWTEYNIVNLVFSDGTITRLIYEHGYFNVTLNKYVYVTEANYREYIGHDFVIVDGNNISTVTLVDSYVTYEYSGCYSPVTAYHMNYIVDGMLSMPGGIEGIFNIFEYGEGLKYDEELMNADIDKYGLMSYEELSDYVPYEMYCAFPAKYFNVAIGKGMITYDEILAYIDKYLGRHDLDKKE